MNNILMRVTDVIASRLGHDPEVLRPDTNLATWLGDDGMLAVELALAFAREFAIDITDIDVASLQTLADAEQLIRERVQCHERV